VKIDEGENTFEALPSHVINLLVPFRESGIVYVEGLPKEEGDAELYKAGERLKPKKKPAASTGQA
jgi:hypothetical protein